MSSIWKGVAALCAVAGLLALTAGPASASYQIPKTRYADSGSYCANSEGNWLLQVHTAGQTTVVKTASANYSRQYFGFSCGSASPANAGVLATYSVIERWNGSVPVTCRSTPWTANAQGAYDVYSGDEWLPLGCGGGWYRQHVMSRITYAGVNYQADASAMADTPIVSGWEDL